MEPSVDVSERIMGKPAVSAEAGQSDIKIYSSYRFVTG